MLLNWTLLAMLPYLAASASLGEFLLPEVTERDDSPAEDPPPKISKHRNLIPSIERLHLMQSDYDENIEPSYQNLDFETDRFQKNLQAFTAKRSNLRQATFTVEPKASSSGLDSNKPGQSSRRHRAFNLPAQDGIIGEVSGIGHKRRSKRGASSPAVDAVDDNPAQWRRLDSTKPQFVTSRSQPAATPTRTYYAGVPQHRVGHTVDENDMHNMRYNEIPLQQREPPRYPSNYIREPVGYRDGEPPRRIIYYANLPEDSRRRPIEPVDYRRERMGYDDRYDYARSYSKYPRESRYEDNPIRPQLNRDDRYRYRQPGNSGSYAIVDAERPPPRNSYPPSPISTAFRDPDTMSKYNRIPAPYQQPQDGGRYAYDQRRPGPPPDRPNAALHPSRYTPYSRNGNQPRNQLTVTPASPAAGSEPYRDYNPRQPAPWSLQIGTKLTVKDDGRPMPSPGGQRFYVQSQQQYPTRYLRTEDDLDTRQF